MFKTIGVVLVEWVLLYHLFEHHFLNDTCDFTRSFAMSWSILGLQLLKYDKMIPSATVMAFNPARYNFAEDLLSLRHLVRWQCRLFHAPWPLFRVSFISSTPLTQSS